MTGQAAEGQLLAGITVLVVDDHDDTREVVTVMLLSHGASILTADSPDAALVVLQRERPDVLLSDIGMPGNGMSLIQRVRALPADSGGATPAAAITAFTSPDDQARALGAGFQLHIPKPLEPIQLAMAVASLADRGHPTT